MIPSKEFVRIDKTLHDRESFRCGEPELDEYVLQFAARHMASGISTTMVLPASEKSNDKFSVCAFYSVSPGSVDRKTLPPDYKKRLPYYPVPVFLIGQMAVHTECQGQGLGKITLVKALEYLRNVNTMLKANAVIVDCLNETVQSFYAKYGFQVMESKGPRIRMFLPMKTVVELFT
ncbi:MAG: GNAT family N-acetyltransferase [Dehalococcoidales bacterium]|nr:GNAT family N-acetyltransferase [Dehalococcoidales bacterium]